MRINNNLIGLNSHRQLSKNKKSASKIMEKLSSGLRINRASDDAAGLAISEKMRGQIRGLNQATRNVQDGISLIQTAEGALNETHEMLQRMRELAVQSATDTNTYEDREKIQVEIDQLTKEVDMIGSTTQFNTLQLLDGGYKDKLFQIGANENQNIGLTIGDMGAHALKITTDIIEENEESGEINGTPASVQTAGPLVDRITSIDIKKNSNYSGQHRIEIYWDYVTNKAMARLLDGAAGMDLVDGTNEVLVGDGKDIKIGDITFTIKSDNIPDGITTGFVVPIITTAYIPDENNPDSNIPQNNTIKGLDVKSQKNANTAIGIFDDAIEKVSSERSKLGAIQNRLEHTMNNLGVSAENLQASESRIRDIDVAKEIMELTKVNILQQASQAMLAQANIKPEAILQLLL